MLDVQGARDADNRSSADNIVRMLGMRPISPNPCGRQYDHSTVWHKRAIPGRPRRGNAAAQILPPPPPPNELPKVQVVSEASVKSAADGIILSTDWDFASAAPPQVDGISLPFMWPKATSIDSSHSVIRFHTEVEPSVVFVEGYGLFRPDNIGEPPSVSGNFVELEEPLAEYECSRFQVDSCMRITPDGFVELHDMPAEIFELPHILVFAKWSIDPEDDPDGSAMANWVFHVENAGGPPE